MSTHNQERRSFLAKAAGLALAPYALSNDAVAEVYLHQRKIPSSGSAIPGIGMGSWLTFDVNPSGSSLEKRIEILKTFFSMGGRVIDSSPMYGQSEAVIGKCLQALSEPNATFSASKVWTSGKEKGIAQMQTSQTLWRQKRFNLMQIHNLVDWKTHIRTLLDWKEKGLVEYIGVTTYGGLRHREIKEVMANYPIDFVQLTYNIVDREAETVLLPLALKKGIAVIANRPFREGRLFDYVNKKALPDWAKEWGCENWAQYFLKFILAHPAITCAIPATSKVAHMKENMGALVGKVPKIEEQAKLVAYFKR